MWRLLVISVVLMLLLGEGARFVLRGVGKLGIHERE